MSAATEIYVTRVLWQDATKKKEKEESKEDKYDLSDLAKARMDFLKLRPATAFTKQRLIPSFGSVNLELPSQEEIFARLLNFYPLGIGFATNKGITCWSVDLEDDNL